MKLFWRVFSPFSEYKFSPSVRIQQRKRKTFLSVEPLILFCLFPLVYFHPYKIAECDRRESPGDSVGIRIRGRITQKRRRPVNRAQYISSSMPLSPYLFVDYSTCRVLITYVLYSASDAFGHFANQCKFISLCDLHCVGDHETKDFNRKNSGSICKHWRFSIR